MIECVLINRSFHHFGTFYQNQGHLIGFNCHRKSNTINFLLTYLLVWRLAFSKHQQINSTMDSNYFPKQRDPRMSLQPGSIILSPTFSCYTNDDEMILEPETGWEFTNLFISSPSFENSDSEDNTVHNQITTDAIGNTSNSSRSKTELRRIRNEFIKQITIPSPDPGYIRCYLCDQEIWGPNGKLVYIQPLFHG